MTKFYDTCSLLVAMEDAFEEFFYISSITYKELENIKTAFNKDNEIKSKARKLTKLLNKYPNKYEVIIYKDEYKTYIEELSLEVTDDTKIIASYYNFFKDTSCCLFLSEDISCRNIAKNCFKIKNVGFVQKKNTHYSGFKTAHLSDEDLANFYSNRDINLYNLNINEYLVIHTEDNQIDCYKWTALGHERVFAKEYHSKYFGKIKPYKNDIYQRMVLDSFSSNEITMVGGPAGSGKTYLSLGYLFSQLERGKIDRIVILCNPVVARNAAKLGFYPGSSIEKILSSQVGAVLASKIGDMSEVERLISQGEIVLLPAGDARGYQIPERSGVYILEAQNLDIVLLRMLLQRIGENCITIIDGDREEQTDMEIYSGDNNGMKKMSEVFKGADFFGQVDLQNIYRSKIAKLADKMR